MPQITAWECPKTKTIFKHKHQYKKHLKKIARESLDAKYRQKIVDSRLEVFKTMRETCKNAAEIEQFVKDNVKVFWAHGIENSPYDRNKKIPDDLECYEFKIEATHKDNVSNSHQCPINGGVTNWHGKDDLPKGYPGFHGRVHFKFSHETPGFCSSVWKDTGLETGTGGGGAKGGSYDIFIFDADWPALSDRFETSKIEWQKGYDQAKAEWQAKHDAAKAKFDSEYPAKKEAYDKEMMEDVLRGKREFVREYDSDWHHRFIFSDFSHPKFVTKL